MPAPADSYPNALQLPTETVRKQVRVIAALVRREMLARFGERRLGYLWALIEPILHLSILIVLFTYIQMRHTPLGGNLALFMLTGMLPYYCYSKLAIPLGSAIESNRALLNLPPVKPFDVFVSRSILETGTWLVGCLILFGCIFFIAGVDVAPSDPLSVTCALAGAVALGVGIGITNAIIRLYIRSWMTLFNVTTSPLWLLSGIWFLPIHVPPPYREYLLYNPLMHYIMWARSGFYRGYGPSELDRMYALQWSGAALLLGLVLLRMNRRKLVEPQ
jgi:capsular polysaccharide transport system permease protein